jgi:hypothetical protein
MVMKSIGIVFLVGLAIQALSGQATSSRVEIVTAYSQNGSFYLRSIPYDSTFPSLPGTTSVYRAGSSAPLYTLERGFDAVDNDSNNLILSNDGHTIFYLITWAADETKEGLKSVSIYRDGKLVQSYTTEEITGCDLKKERCDVEYSNYADVVDKEKSHAGTIEYKKTFRSGISDEEKFLSDFPVFAFDDTVYLTDSKKNLHRFSLSEGRLVDTVPFASLYSEIRQKGRFVRVVLENYEVPLYEFPKMTSGLDATTALASYLGMKPYSISSTKDEQFRRYGCKITGYLHQDGRFEVETLELFDDLPREKIVSFFNSNRFDTRKVPKVFAKWLVDDEYFFFRKADDRLARKERRDQIRQQEAELRQRLVAETIDGRYIPANLGEAFVELDKLLPEIDRVEMTALPNRNEMNRYHMGLGMWIRNNWGLWGGSRLQKYFTDRGIHHPDYMSGILLEYYREWLHGKKDSWREWEETNPIATLVPARSPSALLRFSIPKWMADKNLRIEDAYKWIYQATRGGEHAVQDETSARNWLDEEWRTLDTPAANEPVWEPLCAGGDIGRLNLRPFKKRGGKKDDLLEAFLASSREFRTKQTRFVDAWLELGKRLKKGSIGRLNFDSWERLDAEMEAQDYPAISHSETYEKAEHPAYRVLTSAQMKKLLGRSK